MRDPSGVSVWEGNGISGWKTYSVEQAAGGYWTVRVDRSEKDPFEDAFVIVRGLQPTGFLSPEKFW